MLVLGCIAFSWTASAQTNNTIQTVAGPPRFTTTALLAALPNPSGIAEDVSGNIYVAAQYSYYVYKVNPSTGAMSIFAGTGISGFSGDGGPAASAALSAPVAVAVDNNSGNVYIVDNNRIRVVNSGIINTYAGTGQACGSPIGGCGDNGLAITATFGNPKAVYVDGFGNLFIADTGDQLIRFINTESTPVTITGITVQPGYIVAVAGNGLVCNGPTYVCGDGGSATQPGPSGARLDLPAGVATDSAGNIYIGDTRDQRIRCVANGTGGCHDTSTVTGEIVTYAGSGLFCPRPTGPCNDGQTPLNAQFHNPSGVWADSAGNLYIADQWDNKIREVTVAICKQGTTCVTTVAGTGDAGFAGDEGKAQKAELDGPLAVILNASGNMTIADSGNGRIRQTVSSIINTIAGGGSNGDGGAATAASLANPATVAWDATGTNYYIADAAYNRIREVSANNISTVAGTGQPTGFDPTENGDGGSAFLATLNNPNGVAVDAAGNLYIADTTNALIRAVNMQATPVTLLSVTIEPGDIATVAGSGNKCENPTGLCGDGAPATDSGARITYPSSVALDGRGNLYIADNYDNRVREVIAVAGACGKFAALKVGDICTLAGTGTAGYNGDDIPAYTAELHHPYGVAADNDGNVYIADSENNRVRCVIGAAGGCGGSAYGAGTITTYAYDGGKTFAGNGGPANLASRPIPLEVALDPAGNLFVGGGAVLDVQRVDAATQMVITVAGNGKLGFGGDGGPSTQATLDNLGLSVDGAGNLLIADTGNNRIREVDMVPVVAQFQMKLGFGTIQDGTTSQTMYATMQNYGLATLPIYSTQIQGADEAYFPIVSNTCINQLPPGPTHGTDKSTCSVGIQFAPTAPGPYNATLIINTSLGQEMWKLSGQGCSSNCATK
jgi:trimeric autotransporter adhesin